MVDELALVSLLLAAIALISCLAVDNQRAIRKLPRGLWLVIILLVPMVGPVAWFVAGRPLAIRSRRAGWRKLPGLRNRPTPTAPDDDADFLRSLDQPAAEGRAEPHQRRETDPEAGERRSTDPDPDD